MSGAYGASGTLLKCKSVVLTLFSFIFDQPVLRPTLYLKEAKGMAPLAHLSGANYS